ncbi:hypothetical protein JCM8202v2_003167 [Rhodotorula sphaerocarpa]
MVRVATSVIGALSFAAVSTARPVHELAAAQDLNETSGFYNPTAGGGSWLTVAVQSATRTLGEPINIVVSNASDPSILTEAGFIDYAHSLNFSTDCLGVTLGGTQSADLGDGLGFHPQANILREDFGNLERGTCDESLQGGNHFRMFHQNGSSADSGAWFLAASKEQNLTLHHMIVPNGYDLGRNDLVSRALTPGGTRSPTTGVLYTADAKNVSGVGYFSGVTTSEINHDIAIDGQITVLTVRRLSAPAAVANNAT